MISLPRTDVHLTTVRAPAVIASIAQRQVVALVSQQCVPASGPYAVKMDPRRGPATYVASISVLAAQPPRAREHDGAISSPLCLRFGKLAPVL